MTLLWWSVQHAAIRWRRRYIGLLAAWHELACAECRVSWTSWRRRIVGDPRGFNTRRYG